MFWPRAIGIAFLPLLVIGCSHNSSPPDESAPATQVSDAPSPDALAEKIQDYTNDLAPRLGRHQDSQSAPTLSSPATQSAPAVSQNEIPDSLNLSPYKPDTTAPALALSPVPTPAPQPAPAPPPTHTAGDANLPLAIPAADTTGAQFDSAAPLDPLQNKLATRVRDYPSDLEGQLDYELLMFIKDRPVPDMNTMSGLADEDRQVLSAMMDGLSNFRSLIRRDGNALLSTKVQPLLSMSDRLRSEAELSVDTLVLCSQVSSFGVYSPIDPPRFTAGLPSQMVVYCQVQNFQSSLTDQSQWQTNLTESMTLYTDAGAPAWPDKQQLYQVTDVSRTKRHDFFIAKLITLPASLSAGNYILKVTVTDQQANRIAESTAPLELAAP